MPGDMSEGNRQQQEEEQAVLASIYGEEAVTAEGDSQLRILIPGPEPNQPGDAPSGRRLFLHCALPDTYPSAHPPLFELHSEWLPYEVLDSLTCELEGRFSPGESRPAAAPSAPPLLQTGPGAGILTAA